MEYGDIPNRMTRAAAAGDKSPCQAVRPPTGRVSGSHPYLEGRIHGFKAESQSSLFRSVSQAHTSHYYHDYQSIPFLSQSSISELFSCG